MLVDDHPFMRELVSARLGQDENGFEVLVQVGNAAAALESCSRLKPNLLIVDINLPDRSGFEIVPEVRKNSPQTRILLCSALPLGQRIDECLRSGADGFIEMTTSWVEFLEAVRRVSRGESYFSTNTSCMRPGSPASQKTDSALLDLTTREREVLALLAEEHTSKEIASRLGVSVLTIETHRSNLMRKIGVRNVVGLVLSAIRRGLIDLEPKGRQRD